MGDDADKTPKDMRITRRQAFSRVGSGVLAVGAGTLGYTFGIEPHWPVLIDRAMPIDFLPKSLVGKTLVQISDLHFGPVVDTEYLRGCLAWVRDLNPDFVVITGDFMTCVGDEQVELVVDVIDHALRPKRQHTLAILGNHDYGSSARRAWVADLLTNALKYIGVHVLRNQVASIDGLYIGGIDDYWGPNYHPTRVTNALRQLSATLVLCHNPDVVDAPVWLGYQGWILSGHTHGGQCRAPWLGPPILPIRNARYAEGHIDLGDGRQLYVNRGLGYLHRVRFNARPEITRFTLEAAGGITAPT